MNKTQVKFCGLKTAQDVTAAIACGVDAVGFVLVEKSPRYVTIEQAMPLVKQVQQAGIQAVALFADHTADQVHAMSAMIKPDVLQFHGREAETFCNQFNRPYWKAVPMLETQNHQQYMAPVSYTHLTLPTICSV